MKSDKWEQWHSALAEVGRLSDGLGRKVDSEIVETVAIMRLMGFHTIMSCEGHLHRFTHGPYVIFGSPLYDLYQKKYKQIGDQSNPEYKKLHKEAQHRNLLERRKLLPYLEQFYADRSVSYAKRLIITDIGAKLSHLRCQGIDFALIATDKEKRAILEDSQAEMKAFTEHMKAAYFSQPLDKTPSR